MDEMINTLVRVLTKVGIPFVVIGGIASALLGKPRMTIDANVVVHIAPDKVDSLIKSMKENGFNITTSSESKIVSRMKRGSPLNLGMRSDIQWIYG